MKHAPKYACLITCLLLAACGTAEKDLYHYQPTTAGEVPATFNNKMITIPVQTGMITKTVLAKIQKINGKYTSFPYPGFFSTKTQADEVVTYQLSPGLNTLHLMVYPGNGPGDWIQGIQQADLQLNALPGEKYSVNYCGNGPNIIIGLCVTDSAGKIITGKTYTINAR